MKTTMMKELESIDRWDSADHAPDRVEAYKGTFNHSHFMVLKWTLDDGASGYDGTYSHAGMVSRMTHDAAEHGFKVARAKFARLHMSPWSREWFDRLEQEVTTYAANLPQDALPQDALEHARNRYNWVVNHCATQVVNADNDAVRNNIGKGLAALGIATPVGFF